MAKVGSQFYVYRFDNDEGQCIYIGKGSGHRLKAQNRRFGRVGYVVKWFASERAAFNFEARLIAKLKPAENKVAGGGGAIARVKVKPYRRSADEIEMERIGTRAFVAKMLLRFDMRGHLPPERIAEIRHNCQAYLETQSS